MGETLAQLMRVSFMGQPCLTQWWKAVPRIVVQRLSWRFFAIMLRDKLLGFGPALSLLSDRRVLFTSLSS